MPPTRTQLLDEIEKAVRNGLDPDQIEERLLKPLKLGSEMVASLWLYAWGLCERASRQPKTDDVSDRRRGRRHRGEP